MINLMKLSEATLKSIHKIIHMDQYPEITIAFFNIFFDKDDQTLEPFHREECLDVLEDSILKKIGEMRSDKSDTKPMVIRKSDIKK